MWHRRQGEAVSRLLLSSPRHRLVARFTEAHETAGGRLVKPAQGLTTPPWARDVGPSCRRVVAEGFLVALILAILGITGCRQGTDTAPDVVPVAERQAHLEAMKVRSAEPSQFRAMSIAEVIALPRVPRTYSRAQLIAIAAREDEGVTVTGYLTRLRAMDDGDYHLELTATPRGRCLTWYKPRGLLVTELTPVVRARQPAYTFERLVPLCGAATPIRISGWLLYDSPHSRDWWRSTPWEVHPITRIEVCCWRDLTE